MEGIWAPPFGSRFPLQSFQYKINIIYRKWVEKAVYISYSVSIGKDFHFNRWRRKNTNTCSQSLVKKAMLLFCVRDSSGILLLLKVRSLRLEAKDKADSPTPDVLILREIEFLLAISSGGTPK